MNEKISVVVRCWNSGKTLRRCLDSIVNQTYDNIQLVVVDDGSTDNSIDIIREYIEEGNVEIKLVRQEHKGAFFALKNGVKNATGTWLGFVDTDDCIDLDMYQAMYRTALQYKAECVQCENYFLDEDGGTKENQRVKELLVFDRLQTMEHFVNGTSIVRSGLCYKLYKHSLFEDVSWIPSHLAEDIALMYQLYHKVDVFICLPNMYYYTSRSLNSLTRKQFVVQKYDLHDVYDRMKEFFRQHKEYENLVQYAVNSQIGSIFYSAGEMYKVKIASQERNILIKEIKEDIKKILSNERCSFKQKFLLNMIYSAPWLYAIMYKLSNR